MSRDATIYIDIPATLIITLITSNIIIFITIIIIIIILISISLLNVD